MSSLEEARLRGLLRQAQQEVHAVESELASRMTEIREFDAKVEARLGPLETELDILDAQIRHYRKEINRLQSAEMFPNWVDYSKRVNPSARPASASKPDQPPSKPENELRQLYRDLARKYHPDTAFDDLDRQYRHEMMLRINDAYASGDLAELRRHAGGKVHIPLGPEQPAPPAFRSPRERVEAELVACQTKLREIRAQIEKLRFHPTVQLSLSVKLAWRQNKDLVGEMAKELEGKAREKRRERDALMATLQALQARPNDADFGAAEGNV
ncbi:MAG: hypothetical protein HUU38_05720 [Anaerolineales bacterium]|nr:hypothetical protein [Anaerolineales bacterium]